jgi:hypothetical protein
MAIPSISDPRVLVRARVSFACLLGTILLLLGPSQAAATRLCLLPASLPFEEGDERFDVVEEKVAAVFRSAGFKVTDSEEIVDVYKRVDEEWGDIFDPLTGRIIKEKQERLIQEIGGAYRGELGCDALLRISIAVVRAQYQTPTASWDGTTRQVVSTGRTILTMLAGQTEYGWVSALSIWIRLMDPEGNDIGFRSAGIEPLVDFSYSRDLDKLPPDQWLRDEAVLDEAIESALGAGAELLRTEGTSRGAIDETAIDWPSA